MRGSLRLKVGPQQVYRRDRLSRWVYTRLRSRLVNAESAKKTDKLLSLASSARRVHFCLPGRTKNVMQVVIEGETGSFLVSMGMS